MAIDKKLDNARYSGRLGPLKRFFDTEVKNEEGREQSLSVQLQEDFGEGLFWNATPHRDNWGAVSGCSMFGMALGTFFMGLGYITSNDAVEFTDPNSNTNYVEMQSLSADTSSTEANQYTILSRGNDDNAYLLYKNTDGRVFVFEHQRDNGLTSVSDAEDLLKKSRWEWDLMSPDSAYSVIRDFGFSLDEYDGAANDREAGFLYPIAPVTTYQVDSLSVLYNEGDHTRVTTGQVTLDEAPVTLGYINATDETLSAFKDDMVEGHYGYAEGQGPEFTPRDLDESSLNKTTGIFFGTILPFYFLMGAGMGANRVRRRISDVKKGKTNFLPKP